MSQRANGFVVLRHEVGMHARPSVRLTQLAKSFDARIDFGLSAEGPWIDAKSIVKVMRTKTPRDSVLHFRAEGVDAESAVRALIGLIERDFEMET
jgi:phosphocarrier protein HPr